MPAETVERSKVSRVVRFDCFEANLDSGELRKRGTRLRLRDQSFQILAALLEHSGQVVTREYLQQLLWHGDIFVDFEGNLNAAVGHLRQALGDSADHPRIIETLPKRGYRLICETHVEPVPAAEPSRIRLIVLPFANMNRGLTGEYFCDAMTDEIITALARVAPQGLAVIARTTAMHYKGAHKDVARIGRELNARYVVEGAIRREKDRTLLNVQVIQTSDQSHVFARQYEAGLNDVFWLHNSIARDIATHLNLGAVTEEVHRTSAANRREPTHDVEVYNDYIQGRYLAERLIPDEMEKAKHHFESAIRRDPEFALAHMALADLYSWFGYKGYMRPKDAYATGITYALRAVEIEDTLAEAHAVLASYHKQLDYNWPAARQSMARALELNPTSPFVRFSNAMVILMPHNRIEEAVAELRGSLESNPLDTSTRCWLGIMVLLDGRYDLALDEASYMRELEPNSCWPPFIEGIAYRQKYFEESIRGISRPDFAEKSIAAHRKAVELAPGAEHLVAWLGFALGVCGKKDEARAILREFEASREYVLPTNLAHVHLGLGEVDAAFEWFDRAVDERDQNMMPILSYAHFDPLRSDPRFAGLLRKMHLEE